MKNLFLISAISLFVFGILTFMPACHPVYQEPAAPTPSPSPSPKPFGPKFGLSLTYNEFSPNLQKASFDSYLFYFQEVPEVDRKDILKITLEPKLANVQDLPLETQLLKGVRFEWRKPHDDSTPMDLTLYLKAHSAKMFVNTWQKTSAQAAVLFAGGLIVHRFASLPGIAEKIEPKVGVPLSIHFENFTPADQTFQRIKKAFKRL